MSYWFRWKRKKPQTGTNETAAENRIRFSILSVTRVDHRLEHNLTMHQ